MFWISTVTVASPVTVAPGADQLTLVLLGRAGKRGAAGEGAAPEGGAAPAKT